MALEHEENGAQDFVGNGDDGSPLSAPDGQSLEVGLEHRRGSTGGMIELAEKTVDVEVALASMPVLALTSRLVVAWADANPGRQSIGAGEDIHIAGHDSQTYPAIGQYFVLAVRARGQLADHFLPLSCDQTQLAKSCRRHERATYGLFQQMPMLASASSINAQTVICA